MIKPLACDVYNANIILCNSRADLLRLIKMFHEDYLDDWKEDSKDAEGYTIPYHPIIMYSKKGEGTVAHEAVHVICCILEDRGVRYVYPDEESLAYPVGWLVEKWYQKKDWMKWQDFEAMYKKALG